MNTWPLRRARVMAKKTTLNKYLKENKIVLFEDIEIPIIVIKLGILAIFAFFAIIRQMLARNKVDEWANMSESEVVKLANDDMTAAPIANHVVCKTYVNNREELKNIDQNDGQAVRKFRVKFLKQVISGMTKFKPKVNGYVKKDIDHRVKEFKSEIKR
jgi:hypothetical protein